VGSLGPWELLIIAGVIILLFGARKMPDMARSLGKSMRILKAETKGMRNDEDKDEPAAPTQVQAPQQLPQAQQPVQQPQVVQPVQTPVEQPQANANVNKNVS
jgi:sec-independent protein translocase protein TatA